jgi:hypothetical protein
MSSSVARRWRDGLPRFVVAVAQLGGLSAAVNLNKEDLGHGPELLGVRPRQVLLLPPSLREWLPDGHLAWFVIDAVERLDPTAF